MIVWYFMGHLSDPFAEANGQEYSFDERFEGFYWPLIRSLKRTVMDKVLNSQAASICALSLAVGFNRRMSQYTTDVTSLPYPLPPPNLKLKNCISLILTKGISYHYLSP